MKDILKKAEDAVEDQMASDDNYPCDIARAVIMAIRKPDQGVFDRAFAGALEAVYPGDFTRVIDEILRLCDDDAL